jgi:hypothetical protein
VPQPTTLTAYPHYKEKQKKSLSNGYEISGEAGIKNCYAVRREMTVMVSLHKKMDITRITRRALELKFKGKTHLG